MSDNACFPTTLALAQKVDAHLFYKFPEPPKGKGLQIEQAFAPLDAERVIQAALRLIGVLGCSETPAAAEVAECRFHLDSILMEAEGIERYPSPLAYMLAGRIAPVFDRPQPPTLVPFVPLSLTGPLVMTDLDSARLINLFRSKP